MGFQSGRQPSVMKHDFSQVPKVQMQRSVFKRNHGYKTAFNASYLYPVFMDFCLPGDTMTLKMSSFVRLTTPIVPIMDNMVVRTYFFSCPVRLLFANFKKMCGEQVNPNDSTAQVFPTFNAYNPTAESLSDYLGIPPLAGGATISHNSLWHRMYNYVWNNFFRDQNLQNSAVFTDGDGPDNIADYVLRKRNKSHDYFTSCLPWAQKGTAVQLPLTGNAPVRGIAARSGGSTATAGGGGFTWLEADGASMSPAHVSYNAGFADFGVQMQQAGAAGAANLPQIYADLSVVSAATINSLRQAFQIQRMLERDARGGTRFPEVISAHFQVTHPDAQWRPEYLGGSVSPITIQPVAQTSATAGSNALGRLAAVGTSGDARSGFTKSFTEWSCLLGLVCVTADLNYQQGLNRFYSMSTKYDMYWPALANIGEQAVLTKEIYLQGSANPTDDASVFGYQEAYAHYRYKPSQITGKMRSTHATPLDVWHLAQKFTAKPTLGNTFIEENVPVDRVVAVTTEPQFFGDFYFDYKCARPMPTYSVPGYIDHF